MKEKYEKTKEESVFIELGCGVGNSLFPVLNQYPFFRLYGCDFAASAINLINQELKRQECTRMTVVVCDLVKDEIPL